MAFRWGDVVVVDPADAGLQLRRHPVAFVQVGGENASGQAKARLVGAGDGFFFGVKGQHGEHRAKDFFAHDAHMVLAVGEDGGRHEVAGPCLGRPPACRRTPSVAPSGHAAFDVVQHLGGVAW